MSDRSLLQVQTNLDPIHGDMSLSRIAQPGTLVVMSKTTSSLITLGLVCAGLAITVLMASCDQGQVAQNQQESLRIATYNTRLVSPPMVCFRGLDIDEMITAYTMIELLAPSDASDLAGPLGITVKEAVELIECLAEAGDDADTQAKVVASRILAVGVSRILCNHSVV